MHIVYALEHKNTDPRWTLLMQLFTLKHCGIVKPDGLFLDLFYWSSRDGFSSSPIYKQNVLVKGTSYFVYIIICTEKHD